MTWFLSKFLLIWYQIAFINCLMDTDEQIIKASTNPTDQEPYGLLPIPSFANPALYSIDAKYDCTGSVISRINRFKFMQSVNKRCNEVSGEVHNFVMNVTFHNNLSEIIKVNSTQFIDDYKGMRIIALDGIIDEQSVHCGGDSIVLFEIELPRIGNCHIGIFQHESLWAFARLKGKCDAFCPGKVAIKYITPIGNTNKPNA